MHRRLAIFKTGTAASEALGILLDQLLDKSQIIGRSMIFETRTRSRRDNLRRRRPFRVTPRDTSARIVVFVDANQEAVGVS